VESARALEVGVAPTTPRLAALYEEHVGRAIALATLLTGDRAIAEDIAHDAFLRVAGRFGDLRDPHAFGPYLRTTVTNMCRARVRRLERERRFLTRQRTNDAVEPDTSADDRDQVWRSIEALPYRQRAALVLRYWEDLSEQQIGDALRCSPRAVNALLSRARAAIREDIGPHDLGQEDRRSEP
jgi:RNA polymerase sigma factor (sigma-70 family)